LEANLQELEAEKVALNSQKTLYETMAEGKIDIENASAADLAEVRQNLTDFYIESGVDEVNANKLALDAMGLDQETYNKLIADSSEENADNLINSANTGVEKVKTIFSNFVSNLKNVFSNLGKGIKALFTGDWESIGGYFSDAWSATQGTWSALKNDFKASRDNTLGNFKLDGNYTKYQSEAEFEEAKKENLQKAIDSLNDKLAANENATSNVLSKINYLKALKNQDLSEFGSKDPNDIDETGKALKDLAERYHEITREIQAQEHALD
jgi:hypothetical protein